jgi:hypothetical protein
MSGWKEGTLLIKKRKGNRNECGFFPLTLLVINRSETIRILDPTIRSTERGTMILNPDGTTVIYYTDMLRKIYEICEYVPGGKARWKV